MILNDQNLFIIRFEIVEWRSPVSGFGLGKASSECHEREITAASGLRRNYFGGISDAHMTERLDLGTGWWSVTVFLSLHLDLTTKGLVIGVLRDTHTTKVFISAYLGTQRIN